MQSSNAFGVQGHQQQVTIGVPSEYLLTVRLGLSGYRNWPLDGIMQWIVEVPR